MLVLTCRLARCSIELLALPVDLGEGHSIHVDLARDALLGWSTRSDSLRTLIHLPLRVHDKASMVVVPGMLLSLLLLCYALAVTRLLALDLLDALGIGSIAEVIIV